MKTKESSNKYDDSRKISPSVSQHKMQETAQLHGKKLGDGREKSYNKEFGDEEHEENTSIKNDITGKPEQEDVKKEFEIRSKNEVEDTDKDKKTGELTGEKRDGGGNREKDPVGESEEVDSEKDHKDSSWRRSYKGDAEVVS